MSKFTNRADLLIAAGESIKMQEAAGISPVCKSFDPDNPLSKIGIYEISECPFSAQNGCRVDYEFPIAIVEGKPVFVGDELYHNPNGDDIWYSFIVSECHVNGGAITPLEECKWNPPKPKTVMVEMLREDAEHWAKTIFANSIHCESLHLKEACRKALEKK